VSLQTDMHVSYVVCIFEFL